MFKLLLVRCVLLAFLYVPWMGTAQDSLFTYQGKVTSGGKEFTGTGKFKFALVSLDQETISLWSNDGTSSGGNEPEASLVVKVAKGLVQVTLGDTNTPGMKQLDTEIFSEPRLRLRIWFNDGTNGFAQLSPDQPVTTVPKAAMADALTGFLPASQIQGTLSPASLPELDATNLTSGTLHPSQIPELDASQITTGTLPETLLPTNVVTRENRIIVVDGDSITESDSWLRFFTNLTWFTSANTIVLTNFATGSDGIGYGHPDRLRSEGRKQISRIEVDGTGFATAICSNIDLTGSRLPQKKVVIDSPSHPELNGYYRISSPRMANSNSIFTFDTGLSERVILDGYLDTGLLSRYARYIRPLRPRAGQAGYFICYVGLNDGGRVKQSGDLSGMYDSAGGWANAYSNLMTCARADGFKVIAFTQHTTRSLWSGNSRNVQSAMNNYIRTQKVAETGAPLWDYLVDLEQGLPNPFDTRFNNDGLHLTPEGYNLVAVEVDRVLRGATHYSAPNTYFSPEIATTPIYTGTTNPTSYFAAPPGTLYLWRGGPPGQVLWVKESGTNALGWVPK